MKFLGHPSSGSEQGQTSSHSRFGQYKRSRRAPVNPNTTRQSLVRSRLVAASQAWRGLSDATRAAWSAYAATVTRQDSLGQTISPTGAQAFTGLYAALANAGLAVPPSVPTTSAPAAPIITALTIQWGVNVGLITSVAPTVGTPLVMEMSPPLSAGVSFSQDLRFIRVATAAPGGVVTFATEYQAKFGVPPTGRRIFVRLRFVNVTGGQSAAAVQSALVT